MPLNGSCSCTLAVFALSSTFFLALSQAQAEPTKVFEGEYLISEYSESSRRSVGGGSAVSLVHSDSSVQRSSKSTQVVNYSSQKHKRFCFKLKQSNPQIKHCEPNALVSIQALSNDPIPQSAISKIEAPSAWNITTGSHAVTVAILDTGGDYNHEDLKGNVWTNTLEVPGDGLDNDQNGYIDDVHGVDLFNVDSDPMDDNGHGTHVGGTIGARGNNGKGISGVAWNLKLQFIKFIGSDGAGSTFSAIKGIEYAVQNGANIINASWGGPFPSDILRDTIAQAQTEGVIFVTAAGNSGTNNDLIQHYPAGYGAEAGLHVLSVAASDENDNLAFFSNYGKNSVHIAAPGVQITSTFPGNLYATLSGTSMAAPHVAGAAALLLSHRPDLSFEQVKQSLLSNGDVASGLIGNLASGARLNIHRALGAEPSSGVVQPVFLSRVPGRTSRRLVAGRTLYFGFVGTPGEAASAAFVLEGRGKEHRCNFNFTFDSEGVRLLRSRFKIGPEVSIENASLVGTSGTELSQPVRERGGNSNGESLKRSEQSKQLRRTCSRIIGALKPVQIRLN